MATVARLEAFEWRRAAYPISVSLLVRSSRRYGTKDEDEDEDGEGQVIGWEKQ